MSLRAKIVTSSLYSFIVITDLLLRYINCSPLASRWFGDLQNHRLEYVRIGLVVHIVPAATTIRCEYLY